MQDSLLECHNCTGYDDGGCRDMMLGNIPEQCQLFEPVKTLSTRKDIVNIRGMKVLITNHVLSKPANTSPLSDEELKGNVINIKA